MKAEKEMELRLVSISFDHFFAVTANARVYEPLRDSKRFVVELPRPNQE